MAEDKGLTGGSLKLFHFRRISSETDTSDWKREYRDKPRSPKVRACVCVEGGGLMVHLDSWGPKQRWTLVEQHQFPPAISLLLLPGLGPLWWGTVAKPRAWWDLLQGLKHQWNIQRFLWTCGKGSSLTSTRISEFTDGMFCFVVCVLGIFGTDVTMRHCRVEEGVWV